MPKARSSWKAYERVVMVALGGRRIPITGRAGPDGDPGDGELPGYRVEVRDRARARPIRWFREVAAEAKADGVRPLLVFKGPTAALSPLVIMRLADFAEVMRRVGPPEGVGPDPAGEGRAAGADPGPGPGPRPGLRGLPAPPAAGSDGD